MTVQNVILVIVQTVQSAILVIVHNEGGFSDRPKRFGGDRPKRLSVVKTVQSVVSVVKTVQNFGQIVHVFW